jgi:aspartate/methionine/tyrosine aminotransferase
VFPRIELLDWYEGRPAAALHDLGTTSLVGDRTDGPAAVPAPLADADDPPAGVNLHSLLATVYGVHPSQVVVTAGATHAAFLALAAAVSTDKAASRVLVELPAYEPHAQSPAAVGATVDRFRRVPEDDWRLSPDRIAAATVEDTGLVTVTNRHNPTGALDDRETLAAAAEAAATADARLLVDEVYAPYATEEPDGPSAFGGPTAAGLEGAVVVNSLSKFHGFPGLRIGWLVADEAFADRVRAVKHHVPAVADVTRRLAARALHAGPSLVAGRRSLLESNAALLRSFVEDRPDVSSAVSPECSFGALAVDGWDVDELVATAWEEAGLLLVPGRFFDADDYVRVALGHDAEASAAALTAFGSVLGPA